MAVSGLIALEDFAARVTCEDDAVHAPHVILTDLGAGESRFANAAGKRIGFLARRRLQKPSWHQINQVVGHPISMTGGDMLK